METLMGRKSKGKEDGSRTGGRMEVVGWGNGWIWTREGESYEGNRRGRPPKE